ncbi:MAG: HEAT repeat domain-containing protein, partial [Planctomycetia bacterium]
TSGTGLPATNRRPGDARPFDAAAVDRRPRPRRAVRRGRKWLRHLILRLISNLSLGFLLVGCAATGSRFGMTPTAATDPIVVLQQDQDPNHRLEAYRKLARAAQPDGRPDAVAMLMEGVRQEGSPLTKSEAVRALGRYSGPEVAKALSTATGDVHPIVRAEACNALAGATDAESLTRLGKMAAADDSVDVRYAAAEALRKRSDQRVTEMLVECLKDDDVTIVKSAHAGLAERSPVDYGTNHAAWSAYLHQGTEGVAQVSNPPKQAAAAKPNGNPSLLPKFLR